MFRFDSFTPVHLAPLVLTIRPKPASCTGSRCANASISGLALYVRLIAAGNPIPTVLITAYPDDAVRDRALNAGVAAYLVKPFSERELLDSIDTALKHKLLLSPIKA